MKSPWNRTHNIDWQQIRNENIARQERRDMIQGIKWTAATLALAVITGAIVFAFFDGLDREAKNHQKYGQWRHVEQTYERPAAYHKAYPTMEQMDSLHALQAVQEVAK